MGNYSESQMYCFLNHCLGDPLQHASNKHALLYLIKEGLDTKYEERELLEKINSAKATFFGWLDSMIDAKESFFTKWFGRKNAVFMRNMAKFDWKDHDLIRGFVDWYHNYRNYCENNCGGSASEGRRGN